MQFGLNERIGKMYEIQGEYFLLDINKITTPKYSVLENEFFQKYFQNVQKWNQQVEVDHYNRSIYI